MNNQVNELIRAFRLWIVNILGIMVPGLIFLFLASAIVTFGTLAIFGEFPIEIDHIATTLSRSWGIALTLVFAYTIGSIFRLSTPDVLDRISAKKVLKNMGIARLRSERREKVREHIKEKSGWGMKIGYWWHSILSTLRSWKRRLFLEESLLLIGQEEAERDRWPYREIDKGNKFPYDFFRDYLCARGHEEDLAKIVPECTKRSKTWLNKRKLQIKAQNADLSAMVESNEAHIRLIFGMWQAVRICFLPLFIIAIAISRTLWISDSETQNLEFGLAVLIVILYGTVWVRLRIENLFHYQRVRELYYIVAAANEIEVSLAKDSKTSNDAGAELS